MTDTHNHIFFGQASALLVSSPSKDVPYIFIRCLKKKPEGSWEKPSNGEGKTIKISMEEIVMILEVFNKKLNNWVSVHSYKQENTRISFTWENGNENKIWINIGEYSKMLTFAQIEILRLLMEHLLKEKIKYATISNSSSKKDNDVDSIQDYGGQNNEKKTTPIHVPENHIIAQKSKPSNEKERITIEATLKGKTQKAILINFQSGQELWVPKSTIHNQFSLNQNHPQTFLIDKWILQKNNVIS